MVLTRILAEPLLALRDKLRWDMRTEFLLYASSTVFMQGSKFITNILVAKLLRPTNQGWWNSLQPFLIYGSMFHLGVLNGMNRDVPYYHGQGDYRRVEHIRKVSLGVVTITTVLSVAVALIASVFLNNNPLISSAVRCLAVVLLFQQWYLYLGMLLRSAIRFDLASIQQVALAALFPALTLPMAWHWGLNGFILAQALVNLCVCLLVTQLAPFGSSLNFDWNEAWRLARVGFPILAGGFLYDVLGALDRWVILTGLGPQAVGHYTLAILSLQAMTLLPNVILAQFYPRMAKRFGEANSYRAVQPLWTRSIQAATAIIWPMALVIFIGIGPFTRLVMPDYESGIRAALIVTAGVAIAGPIRGSTSNFLNAVGKASWLMRTQVAIIGLQLALTVTAVRIGWGLAGVALGVAATQVTNTLALLGLVLRLLGSENRANHA